LIRLLPDGLTVLFCPAAALPALMPVPADPPVAVPVVVPLAGDPVVMLPAAEVPAELPPAVPPLDCASAQVPVNASAVANPNVAIFMIAPFACFRGQHGVAALRSRGSITVRCGLMRGAEFLFSSEKWLA
jgi:hypothetical protein